MLSRVSLALSHHSYDDLLIFRCPLCTPPIVEQTDNNKVEAFENARVEKINKSKKPPSSSNGHRQRPSSSSRKSSKQPTELNKTWTVLRDSYIQVLVLTNATLWSFAPQGLSKLGHMADGCLDLVIVEPASKRDFIRHLKRNGNSKKQKKKKDKMNVCSALSLLISTNFHLQV